MTFPLTNYTSLPFDSVCTLTGGLTTFTSCTLSGNTYTIVTNTKYTTGVIYLSFSGIVNPS